MSEKEPNLGGPDPFSELDAPKRPGPPPGSFHRDKKESSSLPGIGLKLAWRLGKKAALALLRQPIPESIIETLPSEEIPGTEPIKLERPDDRNLTLESEKNLFRRRRWGTFLAGLSFAASCGGGVGFLFIYWTGGSNQALGGCLAAFLGGLSVGLVIHAHLLSVHKEATDSREDMEPPPDQREATAAEFNLGALDLQRRGMLKWMTGIGMGMVAVMFVSLLRSTMSNPFLGLYTRVWKRGQRLMTSDGKPVRADQLQPGSTTIVFPEQALGTEKAQTVLIRVDPSLLQLPSDRSDWAPMGNLAYSRICTHAGCPVGMYETTTHLLMCPCHQSTFDVLRAAQPTGGPAARSLPQLPLYVDADGILCAGGGFSKPPGPGFWGMPT
jgi:ubiquinol-cytochrome c reductase iron-sulfur subunit